jgi:ribosomal protein L11 methyltransferase
VNPPARQRWYAVELQLHADAMDRAAACLWEFPITGIEEHPEHRLVAFSGRPWDVDRLVFALRELGVIPLGPPVVRAIEDEDWLALWKRAWRPTPLGRRLLVVPAWWEAPLDPGRLAVRIDPGRAFGTGTHESTILAWELLEGLLEAEPDRAGWLLDVGTGTGVLALGALSLAPKLRAVATEADPQAVASLRPNLVLNPCPRLHPVTAAALPLRPAAVSVAVANLTAAEHDRVDSALAEVLGDFAHVILSGLLAAQLPALVERWMGRGFSVRARAARGAWRAVRLAGSEAPDPRR